MRIKQLIYIANIRLPTEKAHGHQIMKMCESFARNGLLVTLFHPSRNQSDPILAEQNPFQYYGIKPEFEIHTLPNVDINRIEKYIPRGMFQLLGYLHALLWGLYGTLRAHRKKTALYYTRDIPIVYWLTLLGMPTVFEIHTIPKSREQRFLKMIAKRSALKLTVCLTSFIYERLIKLGFFKKQILVSPDAVDLSLFVNLPSQKECRRQLGLPFDRPIIGYIGKFKVMGHEKGIPELIGAMASLPFQKGRDPFLICVGGPMEAVPHYLEIAALHNVSRERLFFHGHVQVTEVPYWIKTCDVVTIPWPWTEFSAYFTSPMKLFEYMAAGIPIVATNLPSLREILTHGETAWFVEPGNPKALARGIQDILENHSLGISLARNAQKLVNQFTWEKRTKIILDRVEL